MPLVGERRRAFGPLAGSAVSVSPTCAFPEIVGFEVTRGAALPEITSVGFDDAIVDPSELVAFTCTRTMLPTSGSDNLYVLVVAPEMSPHDVPPLSHRCQW
jgi:hypothetical protein